MNTIMEAKAEDVSLQAQNENDDSDTESDNASNTSFGGGVNSKTDQEGFSVFHKKRTARNNASWRGKLNSEVQRRSEKTALPLIFTLWLMEFLRMYRKRIISYKRFYS